MGKCCSENSGCCGGAKEEKKEETCCSSAIAEKTTSCCSGAIHQEGDTTCCDAPVGDEKVVFLAVVPESGSDVIVFDSEGTPQGFSLDKGDAGKLCFSTHGHGMADEFLTPCFDEDGRHGDPEEACFCGNETPHLHAHFHDPRTCQDEHDQGSNTKKTSDGDDFMYLAGLTLHPSGGKDGVRDGLLNWGITESLPKECNSREISRHWEKHGSRRRTRKTRMSKVQHHDHFDYLVHDSSTGELHLEHPCDDCGDNDVHGKFNRVGMRRLPSESTQKMELHFFEVPRRRFHILDHLEGLFDPSAADRVMAALTPTIEGRGHCGSNGNGKLSPTPKTSCCDGGTCNAVADDELEEHGDPEKAPLLGNDKLTRSPYMSGDSKVDGNGTRVMQETTGRSQLHVQSICCASEIPMIRSIVCPMDGVSKVSITVTTKMVYVEHDMSVVTAAQIRDGLNSEQFGASIKHDAADDVIAPLSTFVWSTLSYHMSAVKGLNMDALKQFMGSYDLSLLESFVVDAPSNKINILHNIMMLPLQTIVDKLMEELDMKVTIEIDGATSTLWNFPRQDESTDITDEKIPYPSIPSIFSGVFWVVSMLSFIGGNWENFKYAGLLSAMFGLPPIGMKAFRTLRRFQFDTNVLMFTAAIGALGLQEYTEAAAVTFLFSISEWLEVRATSRARTALSDIVHLRPEKANLIHPVNKETMVVPASVVPVGSLVSVKTGDKIPCDGVVVEGKSTVDESSLSGESRPVRKGPSNKVSGGTINSGSMQLMVRTTSTAENSAVSRLIRLVEEAQANRSPTEQLVDEFAKRYTPIVVLAAMCMCTIPWAFGSDTGREWVYNGLVLVVVACPCALIISTPVTYVAALANCAQHGIMVKGGSHLEALGMVKQIAFDKTGTLTQGSFDLVDLEVSTDFYTREQVLQYLAVVEERASHPLAQAIMTAAKNESVSVPKTMTATSHTQLAGEGVAASVNGAQVHIGNERLFRRLGLFDELNEDCKSKARYWASLGGTVAFMSVDNHGIVCAFCVADAVRPEAASVVKKLHHLGIKPVMLTGDNNDAALAMGKQVGLAPDEIRSQLFPEDKLTIVGEMKGERLANRSSIFSNPFRPSDLVLMCGDGVNDAPALALAHVGVAMGAGAALALETADVTLLDSQLDKLLYSIRMGKTVIGKIRQNIMFSFAVKAVVVGFALAGNAQLWAAIVSDVGAMLIVTLNSMTLLGDRKKIAELNARTSDDEIGIIA